MQPHFHHHGHHHHHPIPFTHTPLLHLCRCCYQPLLLSPLHHHHHHHHHHDHHQQQHTGLLHFPQLPPCGFSSQSPKNPCPVPTGLGKFETFEVSEARGNDSSATGRLQQQELKEVEELGLKEEEEEEEEEEEVFVLTDEWMEFFANSEAKRRLAKQQKKKGSK